jgi:methylmalonyl-CoA mutase
VIPAQDYEQLYAAGVKGIFGPGTPITDSARAVLAAIRAGKKV